MMSIKSFFAVYLVVSLFQLYTCTTGNYLQSCEPELPVLLDTPSRREAADPTMVVYKGEYYLFASKSGGYFHSTDLITLGLDNNK